MKRERALFQGSRLYRQAAEGSTRLLEDLHADDFTFRDEIAAISHNKIIRIDSRESALRWSSAGQKYADGICKQISSEIAVPILLQATVNQYYEVTSGESSPLGRYLKYTLELIYRNVYKSQLVQSKSIDKLIRAVRATALFYQLQALSFIFEEFGKDGDYIELNSYGLESSNNLDSILDQYGKPFPSAEKFTRTLSSTSSAIWQNMEEGLKALEQVLRGDSPQNQKIFEGTIFKDLSSDEPLEFWAGIWARLELALYTYLFSRNVTDNFFSISIFEPFKAPVPPGIDFDLIQNARTELFWEKDWYLRELNNRSTNMIVDRPVVRFSNAPVLYATSFVMIGDSLNWFIEKAIAPYPDNSKVRLSDKIFKQFISEPFEKSIIELFRRNGFSAGNISDNGVWSTQDGKILINHKSGEKCPGEIDSCAFHNELNVVVVSECKIISGPSHSRSMRNIVRKLGELDSEEFHSKLSKKISWLQTTDTFSSIPDTNFLGIIVVDVNIGRIIPGEFRVVDSDDLEYFLQELKKDI